MAKGKGTSFEREVREIPLAKSIMESIADGGLAAIRGSVFGGEMPVLILVATGWACEEMRIVGERFIEAIKAQSQSAGVKKTK